jgi:hypothetical protein
MTVVVVDTWVYMDVHGCTSGVHGCTRVYKKQTGSIIILASKTTATAIELLFAASSDCQ